MWFPNLSDTNQAVKSQKQARGLKFWLEVEEELYYPSSENKGADQLLAIFCASTAQFVSDLFGNHIVGFPMRWLKY